jgi:hypothetical protein
MTCRSRDQRHAIIMLLCVAAAHFVLTLGSLLLATALAGHIDAAQPPATSTASTVFFKSFRFLAQPLSRFWVDTDTSAARVYGWDALNSALWASAFVAAVYGIRAVRRWSRPAAGDAT